VYQGLGPQRDREPRAGDSSTGDDRSCPLGSTTHPHDSQPVHLRALQQSHQCSRGTPARSRGGGGGSSRERRQARPKLLPSKRRERHHSRCHPAPPPSRHLGLHPPDGRQAGGVLQSGKQGGREEGEGGKGGEGGKVGIYFPPFFQVSKLTSSCPPLHLFYLFLGGAGGCVCARDEHLQRSN